jgi:hypothetical protein
MAAEDPRKLEASITVDRSLLLAVGGALGRSKGTMKISELYELGRNLTEGISLQRGDGRW